MGSNTGRRRSGFGIGPLMLLGLLALALVAALNAKDIERYIKLRNM